MGAGMWIIVVAVVLLADYSNPHLGEAGRPPSDLGGGGMV